MNQLILHDKNKAISSLSYILLILKTTNEEQHKVIDFLNKYINKLNASFSYNDLFSSLLNELKDLKYEISIDNVDIIPTPQFNYLIQVFKSLGRNYLDILDNILISVFERTIGNDDKLSLNIVSKLKSLKYFDLDYIYGIYYAKSFENTDFIKAIKYFEKSYKRGNKRSKFEIGEIYANIRELKDIDKAIDIFNDSIKAGIYEAYYSLAFVYWNEVKYRDITAAFLNIDKLLTLNINNELICKCYHLLGYIYFKDAEYKDIDKSISYFKKAIDLGYYQAYLALADIHLRVPEYRDLNQFIECNKKALKHGIYYAYMNLGNVYWKMKQYYNIEKAIDCFTKAMEKHVRGATLSLSGIYFSEQGYIDLKKGEKMLKESIKLNIPYAYFYAGRYLLEDKEHLDLARAEKYFILDNHHKSYREITKYYCNANDYKNALRMALIFTEISDECYVDEIFDTIFNWFDIIPVDVLKSTVLKLKKIDNSNANKILGDIFKNRKLLLYNRENYIDYYLKAIDQDKSNEKAYQALGYCYYYGLGVGCDYHKAYEYFELCEHYHGSCEYIKQVIEAKISVNDGLKLNTEELNDNSTIEDMNRLIDELSNNSIKGEIKQYLLSALQIYVNFSNVEKKNNITLDYSPCITMLFKTLENVIKTYLIYGYRDYLKERVDPKLLAQNSYLVYKTDEGTYEYKDHGKFEKFTLNDFNKIIGYSKYNKRIINSDVKVFNSYQNSLDSNATIATFDRPIFDYLYHLFVKNWHSKCIGDDELSNYLQFLSDYISDVTEAYRNPAVHYQSMTRKDAILILNDLLFDKGIISTFFTRLKGKQRGFGLFNNWFYITNNSFGR